MLIVELYLCRRYFRPSSHLAMESRHTEISAISMAPVTLLHLMEGGRRYVALSAFYFGNDVFFSSFCISHYWIKLSQWLNLAVCKHGLQALARKLFLIVIFIPTWR